MHDNTACNYDANNELDDSCIYEGSTTATETASTTPTAMASAMN